MRNDFWIGGTKLTDKGGFAWIGKNEPMTYTNWFNGQPDNYGGHEDCLQLRNDLTTWNDAPCSDYKLWALCEKTNRKFVFY